MSAGNQAIPNIVTLCKGQRKHLVIKILSLCCSPQVKCVVEGINNIVGLTEHTLWPEDEQARYHASVVFHDESVSSKVVRWWP